MALSPKVDQESTTQFLTTQELSALLSVSTRTIQRWRDAGTIKFSAIGKKFYYNYLHVVEMISNNLNNNGHGTK